jgi:hypothetical protein
MPTYSGKFQYLDEHGGALSQGPCQFRFDGETAIVTPASGTPIAFDLGDVDRAIPGEWDFQLTLFTGRRLKLLQFGAAFAGMREELLAAWQDRTVRCLLLEDLEEVARYSGTAALNGPATPAQIRLYRSNLAVLPRDGLPVQWRLAEVDAVSFDAATYSVTLQSGGERLVLAKLAKQTEEFHANLGDALHALRTSAAEALHGAFPFLDPDRLQRLLQAMPEGRSVPLGPLMAIHPKLPDALIARAVSAPLRPYFDALRARSADDSPMTGFKFIRPDEERMTEEGETQETAAAAPSTDPEEEKQPLFFWFFFPLASGRVAWEATSGSGRATYFFDVAAPVDQSIVRLTRGLALVNFRREPIYLPGESLEQLPQFRRYAIGCRKLPDLRALRAAFRGRAMHTSLEAWTSQVEALEKHQECPETREDS